MISSPIPLPIGLHNFSLVENIKGPQKIKFVNPNTDNFDRNIRHAAQLVRDGLGQPQKGIHVGRGAVVCGSGPSLNQPGVLDQIKERIEQGFVVYATKAAISWLYDRGITADYGVSMDPGAHIAAPHKIRKVPGVKHIIASSSDPHLFSYLMEDNEFGSASEVLVFHSACGLINEVQLYQELFPDGYCVGGGYNVVNRAIGLAQYMGCIPIAVAGNDSGWKNNQAFYCDASQHRPGVDMNDGGAVEFTDSDGNPTMEAQERLNLLEKLKNIKPADYAEEEKAKLAAWEQKIWHTRPDMLASAVSMARLARKMEPNLEFLGDTLPSRLRDKSDDFLKRCADFSNS